ncbi:NAC domain-containing protein 74-like, partial [Raphanus sativus]|uniref:NAC domain-containing protein 74-like n=1 Tax=Raphanus sativus TaxID=3726 RepID=A0A9W3DE17_RAPSA
MALTVGIRNSEETPRISHGRFNPTRVDLINILRKRIDRGERSSLIIDNHILYETAPWLVQHVRHDSFSENEWYYFVTRKPVVTRKPDSWRPCRKVGESGRWKTTGLTKVIDKEGVRIGSLHYASFITNGATQRVGKKTGWTMHEFLLDRPGFQELVLCRIRFHPNKDNDQYAPIFAPLMIGQPQPPPGTEHQGIMGQESNGPLLNEGMEVHQNFGSYGQQQQDHIPRYIGQYGQGFGDMVENQNQFLGQEMTDRLQVPMMMNQDLNEVQLWDGYSGPSLAHH